MVNAALASILRSGRADFNARFAAARRVYPELDPGAFADFLGTAVADLVQAVEKVRADRLGEVTMAAYDVAVELVGQKLAGPGPRRPSIGEAWSRILPKIAALVATSPGRIIPAVCNAVHQLESTAGARPMQWIEIMERLAPECVDADAFFKLGQITAWRAGLAHFRPGALAAADGLPEALTLAAFRARPEDSWAVLRARLLANPWFDPAGERGRPPELRVVAKAGSFKGFGGLFMAPPLVTVSGGQLLVRSGDECWLLTADVHGATFHRAGVGEFEASKGEGCFPGLRVNGSRVEFNGDRLELPALGEVTSAAANATTLAITSCFTHSILLVART